MDGHRARLRRAAAIAVTGVMFGAATVVGGDGIRAVFNLGVKNTVNVTTTLAGTTDGAQLAVSNPLAAPSAAGIAIEVAPGKPPLRVNVDAGKATNLNADLLDGTDGSTFQRKLSSICAAGSSIRAITVLGAVTCEPDNDSAHFRRTVVVSPVGTDLQNGKALRDALAAIPSPSQTNLYLLKIEPGRYDLDTLPLRARQWVDIEGSGRNTIIFGRGDGTGTGTISVEAGVRVSDLKVSSSGGTLAVGLRVAPGVAGARIERVVAGAANASARSAAIENHGTSTVILDSAATGYGAPDSMGILSTGAALRVIGSEAHGSGASRRSSGIFATGGATFEVRRSTVSAFGPASVAGIDAFDRSGLVLEDSIVSADGTSTSHHVEGVHSQEISSTFIRGSRIRATGSFIVQGVAMSGSLLTMDDSLVTTSARTGAPTRIGVSVGGDGFFAHIDRSEVGGERYSVLAQDGASASISLSKLEGGPAESTSTGTVQCAGVTDSFYTFHASSCPPGRA